MFYFFTYIDLEPLNLLTLVVNKYSKLSENASSKIMLNITQKATITASI